MLALSGCNYSGEPAFCFHFFCLSVFSVLVKSLKWFHAHGSLSALIQSWHVCYLHSSILGFSKKHIKHSVLPNFSPPVQPVTLPKIRLDKNSYRSRSRLNNDSKQRHVGSQQCQVASLFFNLDLSNFAKNYFRPLSKSLCF